MKNTTILISALMLMVATTFAQTENVTGISLDKETMNITAGVRNRGNLDATVMPNTAVDRTVFWHSSNEGVAIVWGVDDYVIGISPGTAIITATTRDGGFTSTCVVTVTHVEAESISLNEETLNISVGHSSSRLKTTLMPANASSEIIWSSSNEEVATISSAKFSDLLGGSTIDVDYDAFVNGISPGTATITATTKDGGLSASCEVTVTNVAVEGISFGYETLLAKGFGEELNLNALITPGNASNTGIIWSSSNEEVVTIDRFGDSDIHTGGYAILKVISSGKATITATTVEGNFTATCEVTVPLIEAEGVSLEQETMNVSVGRESDILRAIITPADVSNREVIWSSSNEAVAIISSHRFGIGADLYYGAHASAYIKGISPGTAIITATTADGSFTATCEVTVTDIAVEDIYLNRKTLDIQAGAISGNYLEVFITPANASNPEIIWSSSNEEVAIISITTNHDKNGEYSGIAYIRGLSAGTATITAITADGSFAASCEVRVTYFPVTGISLPETMDVSVGHRSHLLTEITPPNASNKEIIWSSSNEEVATVNEYGYVSGISAGTAIITATTVDGSFTATCDVTVTSVAVTGFSLPETMNVIVGDRTSLRAKITPANASNQQVIWSSSNKAVATVSTTADGIAIVEYAYLNAISPGKAIITATTVDGAFTATCEVTVTPVAVTGISLPETLDINVGYSGRLSAGITPTNATNQSVTWSSSNEEVATVTGSGIMRGFSAGTAIITATTVDGNFTATCEVTVTYVPVTGISLQETMNVNVNNASYENYLSVSIIPENASNREIIWSSSNEAVATVNEYGSVSGISPGTATITATTVDGDFTAMCEVTVTNVAVTGISFGMETMEINTGNDGYLHVIIMPNTASNTAIIWSSSDETIATVVKHEYYDFGSGYAFIRGVSAGTATITATTADGSFTATCKVTVTTGETTGTEAITSTHLAIYPNPTKGFVYLSNATHVQVYTLYGHLLYEGYTNVIDLTPYAQGIYILRAGNESMQVIKK